MSSKETLLESYLTEYTADNRFGFCKIARRKYRFEKYSLEIPFKDIEPKDFIVQDPSTLAKIDTVIRNGSCSTGEFTDIFNELSVNQINYIGF